MVAAQDDSSTGRRRPSTAPDERSDVPADLRDDPRRK
jgi:hypothetical protein